MVVEPTADSDGSWMGYNYNKFNELFLIKENQPGKVTRTTIYGGKLAF